MNRFFFRKADSSQGTHLLCGAAALAMLVAGCGKSSDLAPVTGIVTYRGEPVTEGRVAFYPEKGRPAIGVIQADGSYTLTTFEENDGALIGEHRVTIKATRISEAGEPQSFEEELAQLHAQDLEFTPTPTVEWIVPQEYASPQTTPLRRTVAAGENTIFLDL